MLDFILHDIWNIYNDFMADGVVTTNQIFHEIRIATDRALVKCGVPIHNTTFPLGAFPTDSSSVYLQSSWNKYCEINSFSATFCLRAMVIGTDIA